MNPYITFRDLNRKQQLCYYILQRSYPHYVCVINERPSEEAICEIRINGYALWLTFAGLIQGYYMPAHKDSLKELETEVYNMAEWYRVNRIELTPKKYKKFKINAPGTDK